MDNSKYVVFKVGDWLDEWKQWEDEPDKLHPLTDLQRKRIDDAVVIRQQDIFAGPALHSYAASIGVAITVLRGTRPSIRDDEKAMKTVDNEIIRLQELADFFSEMANEADAKGYKTPD